MCHQLSLYDCCCDRVKAGHKLTFLISVTLQFYTTMDLLEIVSQLVRWGYIAITLSIHLFTLKLQISQLLIEGMILYLVYVFSISTYTVSPLFKCTAHLLPIYHATLVFSSPDPKGQGELLLP